MKFFKRLFPGLIQLPALALAGAMIDPGTLAANQAGLIANAQSSAGGVNFVASAAASLTLTAVSNAVLQLTNGGATVLTLDSAYNIVKTLPQPAAVGQTFSLLVHAAGATTVATPTLSDTAVTLAGTTSVVAAGARLLQGVITQLTSLVQATFTAGTSFTSLTQVGATNNFTVALGTNAVVPVVGTLIYMNPTAGTLPAGWYPINKVTSATSFVIAAPAGTVWTMTSGTVGNTVNPPATYSPLVTITGIYSMVGVTV